MDDNAAHARSPSLLLAELHTGHRDHNIHLPHQHQHALLHKRQTDGTTAVVEVIQTVSVVQQIEVDSNGNTVSTFVTPVPAADTALATTTPVEDSAAASTSAIDGLASSTSQPFSDLSSSSTAVLTSTPSALIPTSSSFASFFVSSNSTTLIASSTASGLSQSRFFNSSSTLSSSLSSFAFLTSSSTSTTRSTTQSTSYAPFSYTSSPTPTSTSVNGVLAGTDGTEIASSSQASSTSSTGSDSGNDSSTTPATPVIIGSVVSSIAGAAFIILVILFVWRWKKRSRSLLPLGSGGSIGEGPEFDSRAIEAPPGLPQPSNSGMVERRSFAYAFPAALANLTGYKRFSQRTETGTISSTAGSERGFYRVSGRKLPSVWQNGGDGYGGGIDETITERHALSGASFYSDHQGFYGGFGGPALNKSARDSGVPVMRPSPARTPVTEQGPFGAPLTLPPTTDLVGRSHPSRDGSHASKFTEEV